MERYVYEGPTYKFNDLVSEHEVIYTYANSLQDAIENIRFKAARNAHSRWPKFNIKKERVKLSPRIEPTKKEIKDIEDSIKDIKPTPTCDKCGTQLTDGGQCPICDLGEEDYESLHEKIVKKGNQYQVQSRKGRNLGIYNTKSEAEKRLKQVEYFKHMDEAITINDNLNPKLFDGENIKSEVSDKIKEIVDIFTTSLKEDGIKIDIKDIILVGSNVNYNYTPSSDLDIHIYYDSKNLNCPDNLYPLLYSSYRSLFNKKFDIDFYGIEVEIFVQPIEELSTLKSNGMYSITQNKWLIKPNKNEIPPKIDEVELDKKFKEWEDKYFELIKGIPVEGKEEARDIEESLKKPLRESVRIDGLEGDNIFNGLKGTIVGEEDNKPLVDVEFPTDEGIKIIKQTFNKENIHEIKEQEIEEALDNAENSLDKGIARFCDSRIGEKYGR